MPRPHLHRQIEEQLHDGRQDASDTRILVVQGLGGSGKSQLVLNYVREYRGDYLTIFWIEAGQKESIERDYLQIHRLLFNTTSLTRPDALSVENAVMAVKSWLRDQTERSLVVLDSADALDDDDDESYINLEFFLPDAPTVDVIITTRHARAAEITTLAVVEVGEMEATEAAELFRKCAKLQSPQPDTSTEVLRPSRPDINTEVLQIVAELGKLALAITLAGSYVAAKPRLRSNIHSYLPEYHERRKELLSVKAKRLVHRYGESILSTWETSFTTVERQSAIAARLLSLLAFLNFDDIFPTLFGPFAGGIKTIEGVNKASKQRWRAYLSPDSPPDSYAIEGAFEVLQTYSLIQWRDERGGYTMHKLVHAWGQDRLEVGQRQYLSLLALELLTGIIPSTAGNSDFRIRLVPHVMTNFTLVSGIIITATDHNEILYSIAVVGVFLHDLGRWSDEYEVWSFLFSKMCESAGTEHPDTLASMSNLAGVLRNQGKYEQAEEMYRQALRLSETVLGNEHPDTLMSMNNLAGVLNDQGKYEQAEEMYRPALRLWKPVLGKEHPLVTMDGLAGMLSDQGKYEQAEEMHRQELRLRETVLGQEHPFTLTSMNNLAGVLRDQGKYEQAEEMHRQELGLCKTVLGQEHPDTLTSMNNLAEVLRNQGKYEQAEEMHRQVLRLWKTVLGKEHPYTLTSMNNLAVVLSDQGKYEEAEEMHQQALRLRETVLGKEHPATLTSMNNLAVVLSDQGKYEQAEEMLQQALRLRETVLGKEHPATLTSMGNLATVFGNQGRLEEAEQLDVDVLEARTRLLGLDHPKTLTSMTNLAYTWESLGRDEDAAGLIRRAERLREAS